MVENNQQWILPENLEKSGQAQREAVDGGKFDGRGDYGAYYAYRKGINYDHIKTHALVDEQSLEEYAASTASFLGMIGLKLDGDLIDMGCAIGSLTNALDLIKPNGRTCGIELSTDGIEVARKKYPKCEFFQQSADKLDNFPDESFDIIHAREFYPFTRTNDLEYHLRFLKAFFPKLKKGGVVVLQMVVLGKGFCNTYHRIKNRLREIGYSDVRREVMVTTKIFRMFGSFVYSKYAYWFFKRVNSILKKLKQTPVAYYYVVIK